MKVNILTATYASDLQDYINNFITNHNVIDIQYQASIGDHCRTMHSAMVIYEEQETVSEQTK